MKKNEKNASKNVANLMRKVEKQELEQATGAGLIIKGPCYFCGLINTNI